MLIEAAVIADRLGIDPAVLILEQDDTARLIRDVVATILLRRDAEENARQEAEMKKHK